MATDILNIPQIALSDLTELQNDYHVGFGGRVQTRVQESRYTDAGQQTKAYPDNVDDLMQDFIVAVVEEDELYRISQASDIVKQRQEKDQRRDVVFKEIKKTVDTFVQLTIFPDKQTKALAIQEKMQKNEIKPDGGLEQQTIATQQWLQEHYASARCQQAAKALGLEESIAELKTLNDEINALTSSRINEQKQKVADELKKARLKTDTAFRALAIMLNAQAIVQNGSELYTALIDFIQQTIQFYRHLADERRRLNRRVAVKSDVVGNHTYATSAGWTWQRLIADGKAALEATPDATIVSTDKKALKAGGLLLTLDGQPVQPTDDIDPNRDYQLVSPSE